MILMMVPSVELIYININNGKGSSSLYDFNDGKGTSSWCGHHE